MTQIQRKHIKGVSVKEGAHKTNVVVKVDPALPGVAEVVGGLNELPTTCDRLYDDRLEPKAVGGITAHVLKLKGAETIGVSLGKSLCTVSAGNPYQRRSWIKLENP